MNNKNLTEISVAAARKVCDKSFLDDELLLFDECAEMPVPQDPMRIKCIIMALCRQGQLVFKTATSTRTVHAGDVFIVNEGQVVGDFESSDDFSGIAIMLSYKMYHDIVQGVHDLSKLFIFTRKHPVFSLLPSEQNSVMQYFNLIKEKVDNMSHLFRYKVTCSLISAMIYDLNNALFRIQHTNEIKLTRAESIFTHFIQLVEDNYKTERAVKWYANQMSLTPKYLCETVKRISMRTPNEWISSYVMAELCVMLSTTTKSIKEIASDMNFANQSFLGKYFKERAGVPPLEYRKK